MKKTSDTGGRIIIVDRGALKSGFLTRIREFIFDELLPNIKEFLRKNVTFMILLGIVSVFRIVFDVCVLFVILFPSFSFSTYQKDFELVADEAFDYYEHHVEDGEWRNYDSIRLYLDNNKGWLDEAGMQSAARIEELGLTYISVNSNRAEFWDYELHHFGVVYYKDRKDASSMRKSLPSSYSMRRMKKGWYEIRNYF